MFLSPDTNHDGHVYKIYPCTIFSIFFLATPLSSIIRLYFPSTLAFVQLYCSPSFVFSCNSSGCNSFFLLHPSLLFLSHFHTCSFPPLMIPNSCIRVCISLSPHFLYSFFASLLVLLSFTLLDLVPVFNSLLFCITTLQMSLQ